MPVGLPPKGVPPSPRYLSLPAGSFLWRVTGRGAPLFSRPNAGPEDSPRWGGRFDPTAEHPDRYCYAALDDLTALCESLLRDVGFDAPRRYLPRESVTGRSLVLVETLRPLCMVSLLEAADLAAAWQDTWLVHAESVDYPKTQLWGQWLRSSMGPDGAGPPAGIIWPSKRQPTGRVVAFFGDHCERAVVRSAFGERRLDDDAGLAWLDRRLALLNTQLGPPPVTHPARHTSNT
jgi:hypothetical protein